MRLVIGAPGNGTVLKDAIKERLAVDRRVSSVVDMSAPGITYPEVSFRAGRAIAEGEADRGILICGTGVGTAIAAGKVPGVRAATAHDLITVRGSVENYDAQNKNKNSPSATTRFLINLFQIKNRFHFHICSKWQSGDLKGTTGGIRS